MKVYCLLLAAALPCVWSAATGGDGGHKRKKRGVDHGHEHEDKQRPYYGAASTQQYETTGFGMAGQDPYYSKMKYYDPLNGERYKAWLGGQAMYGFNFKPVRPVLDRYHPYLQYLLKNGMYAQYKALRTPSNSLWKQYGFSLYGNAGNGKFKTLAQKMRKKRSTSYDGDSYDYSSGGYDYGRGGYDGGYGGGYDGGYDGGNDYGKGGYKSGYDYGKGAGSYGSYYGKGYEGYGKGSYGNHDKYFAYGGNEKGSYGGYGNYGNYGNMGYGKSSYKGYGDMGYGKSSYGGHGDMGYGKGSYGGYGDGGYGSSSYGGGGYGPSSYGGGGYGKSSHYRKKRSANMGGYGGYGGYGKGYGGWGSYGGYQPLVSGIDGYYGRGLKGLVNLAKHGPYSYGGRWGWGGWGGKWGHTYNDFPWTGPMFYNKKFNYEAYNLANILEKYSNKPKYV